MRRARDPDALRAGMQARDLSLREMGLLCECSEGTIRKILAGDAARPELARRVARVLRGNVDALFAPAAASGRQAGDERKAIA